MVLRVLRLEVSVYNVTLSFNTFISFYDFNTSPLTKSPPPGSTGHTIKLHKRRQVYYFELTWN
jgi:hypothetical protein